MVEYGGAMGKYDGIGDGLRVQGGRVAFAPPPSITNNAKVNDNGMSAGGDRRGERQLRGILFHGVDGNGGGEAVKVVAWWLNVKDEMMTCEAFSSGEAWHCGC